METKYIVIISVLSFAVVLAAVLIPLIFLVFLAGGTKKTPTPKQTPTPTSTITPTPSPETNYLFNPPNDLVLETKWSPFESVYFGNQNRNFYFSVGTDSKIGTGISSYDIKTNEKKNTLYLSEKNFQPYLFGSCGLVIIDFQGFTFTCFKVKDTKSLTNALIFAKCDSFGIFATTYLIIYNPYGQSTTDKNFGYFYSFDIYKSNLYLYTNGQLSPTTKDHGRLFVFRYDLQTNKMTFIVNQSITLPSSGENFGQCFSMGTKYLIVGEETKFYTFKRKDEFWETSLIYTNQVVEKNTGTLDTLSYNEGKLFLTFSNMIVLFVQQDDDGSFVQKNLYQVTSDNSSFISDFFIISLTNWNNNASLLSRVNGLTYQLGPAFYSYSSGTKKILSNTLFYNSSNNKVYFYQNDSAVVYKYIMNNACCEA